MPGDELSSKGREIYWGRFGKLSESPLFAKSLGKTAVIADALCEAARAGTLVAFHHDPEHDDNALDRIAAELEQARPGSLVAREGMVLYP